MYWLITENEKVGTSDEEPSALPDGWKILKVNDEQVGTPDSFYINSWEIKEKPPKPSPNCHWNEETKNWVEIPLLSAGVGTNASIPDYLSFRMAMLQDAGYDRITIASNVLRVTRLETAVAQNPPELPVVVMMWGVIIEELTEKPKAAEIKAWNAIASSCNVPIKFGKDGKMILG